VAAGRSTVPIRETVGAVRSRSAWPWPAADADHTFGRQFHRSTHPRGSTADMTHKMRARMATAGTKKLGAVAMTAAMAGALVFATADPASAIVRKSCTSSDFLWVSSNQTTCWAQAGTASVHLYSVYGFSSGNNAGYLDGPSYTVYFPKWASGSLPNTTITTVRIY
jgi:hypothetical protein